MVKIIPFRGIRYTHDVERVVAPPYDVISPRERDAYYKRHEKNVIRLILGKEFKGDRAKHNKYTRARKYLESWLREETLKQEKKPSIYAYHLHYDYKGKKIMKGFIALVKIEKDKILPHEQTLRNAFLDRLQLLRSCKSNFNPIFVLYSDPDYIVEKLLDQNKTLLEDIKVDGIRHKLWRVSDPIIIKKIEREMKDKKIFIADGHHRYAAACAFMEETKYDKVMMYFTNMNKITILPVHRLTIGTKKKKIREFFDMEKVEKKEMFKKMENKKHIFGMYCSKKYHLLFPKKIDELFGEKSIWKEIDLAILHKIMEKLETKQISYEVDKEKSIKLVDEGKFEIVFFVNPPRIEEVRDIALAGKKMPGKATYFYPKLLSGLVINKFG